MAGNVQMACAMCNDCRLENGVQDFTIRTLRGISAKFSLLLEHALVSLSRNVESITDLVHKWLYVKL